MGAKPLMSLSFPRGDIARASKMILDIIYNRYKLKFNNRNTEDP